MSLFVTSRVLVWTPLSTCVRTMKSINTRFPKPLHIHRAKVLHFTRPIKPKDNRSLAEKCTTNKQKLFLERKKLEPPSPIEVWAAGQVRKCFLSSQLVAVFHAEGQTREAEKKLKRRLRKANLELRQYNNKICGLGVAGTKLESMSPLFVDRNVFIVGEEPLVKEMLKITKKVPRIHLLGGFVVDRLMTADEMRNFAQLPPLPVLQGQLAGLLSTATSRTYQLLQANQQRLSSNLGQLVKQSSDGEHGNEDDKKS